jgi:hypothetical protein
MKRLICLALYLSIVSSRAAQSNYSFTRVADTATAEPSGTGTFTSFNYASIEYGTVAFSAFAQGQSHVGLYRLAAGQGLEKVSDIITPAGPPFILDRSHLVYSKSVPGIGNSVIRLDSQTETQIVAWDDPVPFGTGAFNIGIAPFAADFGFVAYSGVGDNDAGLLISNGRQTSLVVDRSSALPGGSSCGPNLLTVGNLDYQSSTIVFTANFPCISRAIYAWTNFTTKLLADLNSNPPLGGKFSSFGELQIVSNQVVFTAKLAGPQPAPEGIYSTPLDGSGAVTTLVDTTQFIPGSNRKFNAFGTVGSFSYKDGLLVFYAGGPNTSDYAIYSYVNGAINRVIGLTDSLDGKTIQTLSLGRQSTSFGILVFIAGFEDGSEGVYQTVVAPALGSNGQILNSAGSSGYSNGSGFSFIFHGTPHQHYIIQYTDSLTMPNWQDLTDFVYVDPLTIFDPGAAGRSGRWYRAVTTPGPPPDIEVLQTFLNRPQFRKIGSFDYFLTSDTDQFSFNFDHLGGPDIDITVTLDGAASDFLDASTQTIQLQAGQVRGLTVKAKSLDPLVYPTAGAAMTLKDRLYIGRVHLHGEEHGGGAVAFDEEVFVYRYLDALDSNHHDGVIEFPRTTLGVTRRRPVEILKGQLNVPAPIQLAANVGFHFESDVAEFVFQHVGGTTINGTNQTEFAIVCTKGELARMKLRAEGHIEKFFVDEAAFKETIRRMAIPEEDPGHLSCRTVTFDDSQRIWLTDVNHQTLIFQLMMDKLIALLSPLGNDFDGGIQRTLDPQEADIVVDRFHSSVSSFPSAITRGELYEFGGIPSSSFVFTCGFLPDGSANRFNLQLESDNQAPYGGAESVFELLGANYSVAERNFRLARGLNQRKGFVELYLDYLIYEKMNFDNPAAVGNLAFHFGEILAHQFGHSLGLVDTYSRLIPKDDFVIFQLDPLLFPSARSDLMGYPTPAAIGQDTDKTYELSIDAFRIALGLDWDTVAADRAINYFQACAQLITESPTHEKVFASPETDFISLLLFHE